MGRSIRIGCFALVVLAAVHQAYAQGTLAGVVRDASGAVLPGVSVEASSPALRTLQPFGKGRNLL